MHSNKLLMLTNSAIGRRNTTRPLGIQFKPFANNVHDTECCRCLWYIKVTYYWELCKAITSEYRINVFTCKVKQVVLTMYNTNDFTW